MPRCQQTLAFLSALLALTAAVAVWRSPSWFPARRHPAEVRDLDALVKLLRERAGLVDCGPSGAGFKAIDRYLSHRPQRPDRLRWLSRIPQNVGAWAGVVQVAVTEPGTWESIDVRGWEGVSLQYQRYLFFGDPTLLHEIRQALGGPEEAANAGRAVLDW